MTKLVFIAGLVATLDDAVIAAIAQYPKLPTLEYTKLLIRVIREAQG